MISLEKKQKIALIGFSLTRGGGDKVMANLSIFFEKNGFEVHTIIILDGVTYPYSGKLVNMGLLKNESNNLTNKYKRLLFIRKYLKENDFDYIIDFRPRTKTFQELIISRFVYKTKTILTVHSFLIDYYMPKSKWLTKLIYNQNYATITIVDSVKNLIENKYQLKNVVTIPNPINLKEIEGKCSEENVIDFQYIIAVGQFESSVKQYDKLILSYSKSILPSKQIHLIILGRGDQEPLRKVALDNNVLEYVHFFGFDTNPYKYLKKAKFLVLSSLNEGMPNVILESLACQTPVIAFDCPSGPREMIIDKQNGLLVENQNLDKLTDAMNRLFLDEELYNNCKKNTLTSIQQFSLDTIGKQWLNLMKINTNSQK